MDSGVRPVSQLLHELHSAGVVSRDGAGNFGGAASEVSVPVLFDSRSRADFGGGAESVRAQYREHRRALFRLGNDGREAGGEFHPATVDFCLRRGCIHSPRPFARIALHADGAAHGLHVRYFGKSGGNGGVFSHRTLLVATSRVVRRAWAARPFVMRTTHLSGNGIAARGGSGDRAYPSA